MNSENITSDPNTLQPAVAKGTTSIEQASVLETDALLSPGQKLYWEYLVWQAHKVIEELEAAEIAQRVPPA